MKDLQILKAHINKIVFDGIITCVAIKTLNIIDSFSCFIIYCMNRMSLVIISNSKSETMSLSWYLNHHPVFLTARSHQFVLEI